MSLSIVILAAGRGKRMASRQPKVLQPIGGRPMLHRIFNTAHTLQPDQLCIVYGHGGDQVRHSLPEATNLHWVEQAEQRGTGHAVRCCLDHLPAQGTVLVLYGDVPLTSEATLRALVDDCAGHTPALLTAHLDDPTGYGRIVRRADDAVEAIVEERDANAAQRAIDEINSGIMALPAAALQRWLPQLRCDNAQGEYYLTDVVAMARAEGLNVTARSTDDLLEITGVNDRRQQATLERALQRRYAAALLDAGVSLRDPERFDLRGTLHAGPDVVIDVNVVLEGTVVLDEGVSIGPGCYLRDVHLGANTQVHAHSVLEGIECGQHCHIGPFARLRPGTQLEDTCRIGNFVEIKKSRLGEGSKVNHLSYLGDATLGAAVNVGAGTITCNYDGANKHHTEIGDRVFIGSNSALVAPVSIGDDATIAAGSVINRPIEAGALGITRSDQRTIRRWRRPNSSS